ncbi:MAG TPA: pyridoxine 5'-phosphate synthase [Fermentimonas caenicola]|mgnify:FL=1|jgi:pyridoxine 5-phosphate synthase|uniref:Pyridoxine 5'-phosphate synthase n=1 Tax=Fermentimonas caenicola TaxID=1562970 RepID=A0A098C348_9BACT|nr:MULTISPECIES: pyridoxine 5'-phosphate synthase [Lascolabacillus]MBP6175058.1 pyridoxine 5'-phosphate synthase [Fermentimonas sp.]MDI9625771.1 pyridoxine 5'-phosphate synthase [Bacteroidota bacterium]TAH60915.1 MAG: pyridoxine 5'-phosphate synthase [Fermentimonas caenicola]MBP6196166.1 pyridoxine 5'-phosphate synthase [Fermentimonas sp.]MBP7103885.1 pyridoxine 5'-phosphate synthase [Fermentimonas sp.]
MTKLSVNINKIATLRNARGGNIPDVIKVAIDCQAFGAEGITVHPRPDQRHIRYSDVFDLQSKVKTEFNIEGNPTPEFISLIEKIRPSQVTLVPDSHDAITSSSGWDTITHKEFLSEVVSKFQSMGVRTSIFVDPNPDIIRAASQIGTDRIELYTGPYAEEFIKNKEKAISPYIEAAKLAKNLGLGVNAGHDLNLDNLNYLYINIPWIKEVSIGHSLISDALYMGLEKTIKAYKDCLKAPQPED